MLQELKKEANYTLTENGALTYASTMDHCLDLFATVGGLRSVTEEVIIDRFVQAYAEDPDTAMKILFYARDVREGLGERRVFRVLLQYLCSRHPASVKKNLQWIAEYGRYDDLLVLMDTPCEQEAVAFLQAQLVKDMTALREDGQEVSLLAKWLPSVNTSDPKKVRLAKKLAKAFGMSEREYRKTLAALRKRIDIIENYLREVDYSFDYAKQPGKALLKYRNAFCAHDGERYREFLDRVDRQEVTMHTATLMPYEITTPFCNRYVSGEEARALDTTWRAQEDFTDGQNALVVIDGSGSMYADINPIPAAVAQSLGLYFAEKNTGVFAGHFITFSERPQLVEVKGDDLQQKLEYISTFDEVANTDLQAVFELILRTAVKNHIPQEEMPDRIFIISDMEFDYCTSGSEETNFEYAKRIFREAGYCLPKVVFWNVAGRTRQVPVTKNEQGVILVSGCNARLFRSVMTDHVDPYEFMRETLESGRYGKIVA